MGRNMETKTLINKNYEYQISKFVEWVGTTKQKESDIFTKLNIEQYINYLKQSGLKPNSISVAVQALKWKARQLGNEVTVENFKRPQLKPYEFISEEEVKYLLRTCPDLTHELILLLSYDCGLSLKEILRLKRKDVFDGAIKTTKGYIVFSPLTKQTLQSYLTGSKLSETDNLFSISYDNAIFDLRNLNRYLDKHINARNLKLSRLETIIKKGFVGAII